MLNKLKADLIMSMKTKDTITRDVLQVLISSFNSFIKDNKLTILTSEQEINLVQRELKQNRESLEFAIKSGRQNLIDEGNQKINLLLSYLPQQMTEEQIEEVIVKALNTLNLIDPNKTDKGKIMKEIMPQLKGKAEGKTTDMILNKFIK